MKAILFRNEDELTADWVEYLYEEAIRNSHRSTEDLESDINALSLNPDILELMSRAEDHSDESIPHFYENVISDSEDDPLGYFQMIALEKRGKRLSWKKLKKWLKELICKILKEHVGDNPKDIIKKVIQAILKFFKGNMPEAVIRLIVFLLAQAFKKGIPKWCKNSAEMELKIMNFSNKVKDSFAGITGGQYLENLVMADTRPITNDELITAKEAYQQSNEELFNVFRGVRFNFEKMYAHYTNYIDLYNGGETEPSKWDIYVAVIKYEPYATAGTNPYGLFEKLKAERRNLSGSLFMTYKKDASGNPIYVDLEGFKAHIAEFPYSLSTQLVYNGVGLTEPVGPGNEFHPILNIGDLCPENCPE